LTFFQKITNIDKERREDMKKLITFNEIEEEKPELFILETLTITTAMAKKNKKHLKKLPSGVVHYSGVSESATSIAWSSIFTVFAFILTFVGVIFVSIPEISIQVEMLVVNGLTDETNIPMFMIFPFLPFMLFGGVFMSFGRKIKVDAFLTPIKFTLNGIRIGLIRTVGKYNKEINKDTSGEVEKGITRFKTSVWTKWQAYANSFMLIGGEAKMIMQVAMSVTVTILSCMYLFSLVG
jgi:hypothetical protein